MLSSFVGTISRRGLESLYPETEHAVPFLIRRAYRSSPTREICYWAVMQDAVALQVQHQLVCERREDAFLILRALADYFGTISSDQMDDDA